uniref:RING-type E3 ubiquitin transferase n=1 Tax=Pipistrellus kuhlii TaxID=59472 RepID=A0A7J7U8K7_PIPKU|nr:hypothetical protein mPipKuh1_011241 [Pipistrellus kuhlii]
MLHEARDRQKFLSDAQTLRDMQHKVESEYQACLRGQESRRDSSEKKRDPFGGQETNAERARFLNGSSSKQVFLGRHWRICLWIKGAGRASERFHQTQHFNSHLTCVLITLVPPGSVPPCLLGSSEARDSL